MAEIVCTFRKSSYSAGEGNCVETADTADRGQAVRDSKRQGGPVITVSREGWQAFLRWFV